jgi:hypothetical protein
VLVFKDSQKIKNKLCDLNFFGGNGFLLG